MQPFEGERIFPLPPHQLWPRMRDAAFLAACIPDGTPHEGGDAATGPSAPSIPASHSWRGSLDVTLEILGGEEPTTMRVLAKKQGHRQFERGRDGGDVDGVRRWDEAALDRRGEGTGRIAQDGAGRVDSRGGQQGDRGCVDRVGGETRIAACGVAQPATPQALPISLVFLAAQQRRRDLQLQDLVGPLVDAADAHVHQVPARAVQRGPAAAAEDLHRAVGRVPGGVRRRTASPGPPACPPSPCSSALSGSALAASFASAAFITSASVARRCHLDGGEVFLHELMLADRLAVLRAVPWRSGSTSSGNPR